MVRMPDIDKQGHFWAGNTITFIIALSTSYIILGLFGGIIGGWLREYLGNNDKMDFKYTVLGSITASLFLFIRKLIYDNY